MTFRSGSNFEYLNLRLMIEIFCGRPTSLAASFTMDQDVAMFNWQQKSECSLTEKRKKLEKQQNNRSQLRRKACRHKASCRASLHNWVLLSSGTMGAKILSKYKYGKWPNSSLIICSFGRNCIRLLLTLYY